MKARSRARGWALQALYAWEARGASPDRLALILDELAESLRVSPRNQLYAAVLVQLVGRNLERVDAVLQRHLTNWRLSRLSAIDRNILRLGAVEILFADDVPPGVTIHEMKRLADHYGTQESARFVGGVLESILREAGKEGAARRR